MSRRDGSSVMTGYPPQQSLDAAAVLMLGTPCWALSVYKSVPVLKKSWPAWLVGFLPVRAHLPLAATPSLAILPGNWPAVAAISPSATNGRLLHPPSMATTVTLDFPATFSACAAPSAAGSLMA